MPAVTGAVQRRLWLTAGWLAIAYVVVTFAVSAAYTSTTTGLGDGPAKVSKALVTSSMTTGFAGAYGELVATLIFLVGALLAARLLRGDGEVTGWLSSCMSGAAVTYVAVLVTTGAASAAALYDGHHGIAVAALTPSATQGNLGYGLSGVAAGVYVLAASGAGHLTRLLPRWFAIVGYIVGVVSLGSVLTVRAGTPTMILWYLWLVVLGVLALRRAGRTATVPVAAGVPA